MPERAFDAPTLAALMARCRFPAVTEPVVCAVSGGPDSMALLALACAVGLQVTAVHIDHGLRSGSVEEADVVAEAAKRFGADFRSERVTVANGPDLEQRARLARRDVLGPMALTGHTADDQAETVLINLLRGTGPSGLAAMRPGPPHPLLGLRRAETVGLCAELGLTPIADPSNLDPRFVRNRVRNEVLPLLNDISKRDVVPLLARTAELTRSLVDDVESRAEALDPTDTRVLRAAEPEVAAAALRRWLRDERGHPPSSDELQRVMAVVRHDTVACQLRQGRRVERTGGYLRLVERSH